MSEAVLTPPAPKLGPRLAAPAAPLPLERQGLVFWAYVHVVRSGIWFPLIVIALRLAGGPAVYAAFGLLLIYAFRGPTESLKALFLSWLLSHLNPGISSMPPNVELLRIGVLLAALSTVLFASLRARNPLLLGRTVSAFVVFGGFVILHSLAVSYAPDVSILKASLYLIMGLTLAVAWFSSRVDVERLQGWIFFWLAAIVFASVPLMFTGLGYFVNAKGFQGILNHPQVFGLTMALTAAWVGGRMLRLRSFYTQDIVLAGFIMLFLLLSESRGAMLAASSGLIFSFVLAQSCRLKPVLTAFSNLRHKRVGFMLVCALFTGALFFDKVSNLVERTISKRTENTSIASAFDASRGRLIEASMQNFYENPVLGIGFGVATKPEELKVKRDPFLGLPISAPIEKGNMYSAMLEEVGFTGSLLFAGLLLTLLGSIMRSGQLEMIWIFFVALMVNVGEAVLFSPNGIGMLVWILVLMATSARTMQKPIAPR
ncbi:MAG: O-antigen ligase family protein [Pseudomonadota bacterium]